MRADRVAPLYRLMAFADTRGTASAIRCWPPLRSTDSHTTPE
jgi:hypothetical protein